MISVSQASSGGGQPSINVMGQSPQKRSILNPMRYIEGKYT